MTAHAAILQAIAIVTEAQRANRYDYPLSIETPLASFSAIQWNGGADAVASETVDRLTLLADELKQSEVQVVDGLR